MSNPHTLLPPGEHLSLKGEKKMKECDTYHPGLLRIYHNFPIALWGERNMRAHVHRLAACVTSLHQLHLPVLSSPETTAKNVVGVC